MGAPGLASETWDPRNESPMDTHDVTTGLHGLTPHPKLVNTSNSVLESQQL